MTLTTHTIRDRAFLAVECDIPRDLTIAEYKAQRPAPVKGRRPLRARVLRARRSSG